ncbi:hypothetical protein MVEN_00654200 [Mycena venus]|uniref:F-box domain-containing protein n=1 Tax=Mycena venus TaxID=2733690 RepID=A0A8H7D5H0_9AGAR|nr:hypothetical protein MVEN_00654200 [Mycena venus]
MRLWKFTAQMSGALWSLTCCNCSFRIVLAGAPCLSTLCPITQIIASYGCNRSPPLLTDWKGWKRLMLIVLQSPMCFRPPRSYAKLSSPTETSSPRPNPSLFHGSKSLTIAGHTRRSANSRSWRLLQICWNVCLDLKDFSAIAPRRTTWSYSLSSAASAQRKPVFLFHLAMPSLEELTSLRFKRSDELLACIRQSLWTLKKLVLMRCTIVPEAIITALRNLPSLTYLLITTESHDEDESDGDDEFSNQQALFGAMCILGTPSDVCPNLTSFGFGYIRTFPWETLLTMAQSRFHPIPDSDHLGRFFCLRIFNVGDSVIPPPPDMVDRLGMLRDEGCDVALLDRGQALQLQGSVCTDLIYSFGGAQ